MVVRPTDLHRVFIQTLLARRVMRSEIGLELYKRAIYAVKKVDRNFEPEYAPNASDFGSFLSEVAELLEDLGMEVKQGREDSKSGAGWIVLVNHDPNGVGMMASDYTPPELTYLREVVAEIISSYPANSIGTLQALRLATEQEPKMTKSAAGSLLGTFVSRGWLARTDRGRYILAPRGIMELETWLSKEFPDYITKCQKCQKIVLSGLACGNSRCEAHYHTYCYDSLVRRHASNAMCLGCKKPFEQTPPTAVGEAAVPRVEDRFVGQARRKRKSQGKRDARDDHDDDDDDDEDTDEDADDIELELAALQRQRDSPRSRQWSGPSQAQGRSQGNANSYVPETQY